MVTGQSAVEDMLRSRECPLVGRNPTTRRSALKTWDQGERRVGRVTRRQQADRGAGERGLTGNAATLFRWSKGAGEEYT